MKHFPLTLAVLLTLVLVSPVFGAPEESVQVQATPTLVSVSLSRETLDFGAIALDQEEEHADAVVVTNNGSVIEDIDVKGSDAACSNPSSNTWTLSATENGADQFMLKICKDSSWTSVINLSTGYERFQDALGVGVGQSFNTKIEMPTSTTVYGEHTARIYVLATEAP